MIMNDNRKNMLGIIVTHGNFAKELLNVAEQIVGNADCCRALSNSGLSDQFLADRIKGIIGENDDLYIVIFVDYYGGSCSMNCVRAVKGNDRTSIISGVNLPIILDFVTKQGTMEPEEIIKHLISRGQESIRVIDL